MSTFKFPTNFEHLSDRFTARINQLASTWPEVDMMAQKIVDLSSFRSDFAWITIAEVLRLPNSHFVTIMSEEGNESKWVSPTLFSNLTFFVGGPSFICNCTSRLGGGSAGGNHFHERPDGGETTRKGFGCAPYSYCRSYLNHNQCNSVRAVNGRGLDRRLHQLRVVPVWSYPESGSTCFYCADRELFLVFITVDLYGTVNFGGFARLYC